MPLEVFQPSDKPVAVVEQQRVLLCNQAAQNRGIEAGLNVSTALALAGELVLVERDISREQQRLAHLAELVYRFSSQSLPYQNSRGDYSLLLEIGGSLRLFNGLNALLTQLGEQLAGNPLNPQGFSHHFGLAHTLKAAELMARFKPVSKHAAHTENGANTANPASNKSSAQKDNHQFSRAHNQLQLAKVPVALLDCEKVAIAQCQDIGLVTLGDVLTLPQATIAKRFNVAFTRYLEQLQGKLPDPQNWYQPASHFNRELFYIDGLRSHSDLQYPMQQLLQVFCHYLQQRQLSCTSIRWTFTRFSKKKHSLRVHLSRAQANYHNLLELSALQLEQLPLDSPVECIVLHCQQLIPMQQQHLDLFAKPDNSGDFCLLADKLTGKLGSEVLWQPGRHNHHLPEQANAPVPFRPAQLRKASNTSHASKDNRANKLTQGEKKKNRKATANSSSRAANGYAEAGNYNETALQQPSWLLQEPLPLQQQGKQILLQGKPLSLLKGPQRLQCNWWTNAASRDYFIAGLAIKARTKHGGHINAQARLETSHRPAHKMSPPQWQGFYWVYYDLQAKRWYLHGEFA
ncbi:MAG: DNA polymerase Y family protein [Pseudomonadales bacterium]|nr:DNA polymerase Y family protein [Pseudomonadales bacterium]